MGRDKIVHGDEVHGDEVVKARSDLEELSDYLATGGGRLRGPDEPCTVEAVPTRLLFQVSICLRAYDLGDASIFFGRDAAT